MEKKKVGIVGLGYVGLPLALLADQKWYDVIGLDTNEERVANLKKKIAPFVDETVTTQLKIATITFTTDDSTLRDVDVVIICVPTPVHKTTPDLGPVKAASKTVGNNLKKGQLVILESTVNPGISETVVLPILEEESGLVCGKDFDLAHCPERINPGDQKWNVSNINRVVGAFSDKGLAKAVEFYSSIISGEVKAMGSLKEAEAVKVVENSFRDINIAFVNELAMSFSKLGINVVNVIEGAATKPFAFMPHFPGCGVGGHCIPVDPYYLIEYAKENGFHHDFLSLARRINNSMPEFTVEQVAATLNDCNKSMKGARVSVLGISYKADIDDCRESPSFEIIKLLKKSGVTVTAYDPFVPQHSSVDTLEAALENVDAVLVATGHTLFKEMKPALLKDKNICGVVDGRNCLNKDEMEAAGLVYRGIGV